jgi:hypothetical protein
VIERDRGFRADVADLDAGAAGGGMPLASALLDTLCDFLLLEPAMVAREEEDAPPMRGVMSGVCSGLTTVVASSRRSPNMRKRVRGFIGRRRLEEGERVQMRRCASTQLALEAGSTSRCLLRPDWLEEPHSQTMIITLVVPCACCIVSL